MKNNIVAGRLGCSFQKFSNRQFIIVSGAPKCGTTSLFNYLSHHTSVIPSKTKETRFFLPDTNPLPRRYRYSMGFEYYQKCFPQTSVEIDPVYLESTPDYLCSADLSLIGSKLPNAIFVMILRDPIDKFCSWYRYSKQRGFISKDTGITDYLNKQISSNNTQTSDPHLYALHQGLYHEYIEPLPLSIKKRIVLIPFYMLVDQPKTVANEVFQILGLDTLSYEGYVFSASNKSSDTSFFSTNRYYIMLRRNTFNVFIDNPWMLKLLRSGNRWLKKLYNSKLSSSDTADITISDNEIIFLKSFYEKDIEILKNLDKLKYASELY